MFLWTPLFLARTAGGALVRAFLVATWAPRTLFDHAARFGPLMPAALVLAWLPMMAVAAVDSEPVLPRSAAEAEPAPSPTASPVEAGPVEVRLEARGERVAALIVDGAERGELRLTDGGGLGGLGLGRLLTELDRLAGQDVVVRAGEGVPAELTAQVRERFAQRANVKDPAR